MHSLNTTTLLTELWKAGFSWLMFWLNLKGMLYMIRDYFLLYTVFANVIINSRSCYRGCLTPVEVHLLKYGFVSDRLVAFPPGWLAVRKLRMMANGNSILNSTASWMWRACLKKEWSLHSCLSRCVFLLLLHFIECIFIITCCSWCL